jgi:hypothetical protein
MSINLNGIAKEFSQNCYISQSCRGNDRPCNKKKKSEILDLIHPCMEVSANRKTFSIFDLKYIKEILKLLPPRR